MGASNGYESDGIYMLEIHHQSGKVSEERYENSRVAWDAYQLQYRCYGKRKLKLYVLASSSIRYSAGTLLAAHNFSGLKGVLQQ